MKTNILPLFLLFFFSALLSQPAVRAQTHTWTGGGSDQLWSTSANWSGGTPSSGSGTSLIFNGAAPYYDPADNDIASPFGLNLLEFNSLTGEFNTGGGTLDFLYNGMARIRQNSTQMANIGNDILVDDGGNAELDITGTGSGVLRFGGTITNNTYIGITRGAATYTAFDGGIVNNGAFNVFSGTVGIWGNVTNNGAFFVNSSLQFNSGITANFQEGGSLTGTAASTVEFGGGAVNFNGATPYTATLAGTTMLNSSTLGGAANFTLDLTGGFFDWRTGTFGGTSSQTATVKLSSGQLEGPGTKAISRSLTFDGGTLAWNGGNIDLGATGNLTFDGYTSSMTINASSGAGNILASGSNQLTLNAALFYKNTGPATVIEIQPNVVADSNSMFVASEGGIKFSGGGTFNSTVLTAFGGGWLDFAGGTANLEGTTSLTAGAGGTRITGGQVNVNGNSVSINSHVTLEAGATLGGSATSYTLGNDTRAFYWNGGTLAGGASSTVTVNSFASLLTSAAKTIDGRSVILGDQGGTWFEGDLTLNNANLSVNGGVFAVRPDAPVTLNATNGTLFVNTVFNKSPGEHAAFINAPINIGSGGTVRAQSRLVLNGGGVVNAGGTLDVFTDGKIEFAGGTFDLYGNTPLGGFTTPYGDFIISSGATVNIKDSGATINQNANLTLAGGTLGGADVFYTIAGAGFEWTGGTLSGPNTTFVVAPALISGTSAKTISGGPGLQFTDVQFSSGTWTGGDINLNNGRLNVAEGGTFTVQSDQAINATGNSSLLVSTGGTFLKNATTGTTTINALVTAIGTIRADSGKILLTGGGVGGTGVFATTAGGTIEFGGGTFELTGAAPFGSFNAPLGGDFLISAGSVNVNTTGANVNQDSTLTLAGGTLGGTAANYSISGGEFHWTGGTISGPAGSGAFVNAPATLSGPDTKTLSGRGAGFFNPGTWWTGGDIVLDNASITIGNNGPFTIQSDQALDLTGTGQIFVLNGGLLVKDTTTGTTTINAPVSASGTVRADSGKILLTGGGGTGGGGVFATSAGGTIEFGGGTFELNNSTGFGSFDAPLGGDFLISSGATVNVNSLDAVINQNANLTLAGGTLGGDAVPYTLSGASFHWTGGTISGPETSGVDITAPTTISGSAAKTVENRTVFLNSGATWTGGDITVNGAEFKTSQTFNAQAEATLGGTGLIVNSGTFIKTGASTTTIAAGFKNLSSIEVAEGTLVVDSTIGSVGTVHVHAPGTLAGNGTINNPVTVAGTVSPGHSPGTLTFGNDVTFLDGSTYFFELGALKDDNTGGIAGTDWDLLSFTGAASLTFDLNSMLVLDFASIPSPNTFNAFWDGVTDRSWLIAELDEGVLDYAGLSISNPDWAAGTFSLTNTGNDLYLSFTAVPEPHTVSLLALGALWPVCRFFRKRLRTTRHA